MPTGERAHIAGRAVGPGAGARRHPRRGFTYLALLFAVAVAGAALAALAPRWQRAAEREREAEWLFRGRQIADALTLYARHSPAGSARRPQQLEQLLQDRRHDPPLQHLRRLYADPFTGASDWVLLRDADGGIRGLHSRSSQPLLRVALPGVSLRQPTQAKGEPRSSAGLPADPFAEPLADPLAVAPTVLARDGWFLPDSDAPPAGATRMPRSSPR